MLLLNFKCDHEKIPNNKPVYVRAMPMYSAADWLKEPVNRCLQHLSPIDKFNKGKLNLKTLKILCLACFFFCWVKKSKKPVLCSINHIIFEYKIFIKIKKNLIFK